MTSDQDQDKSLEATPFKLERAKEKGQVSKSTEVVSFAVLAVAVVYGSWQGC